MREKTKKLCRRYLELGEGEEAAAQAQAEIFSTKTLSKKKLADHLEKTIYSESGKLYLQALRSRPEKSKKIRKKPARFIEKLEESTENLTDCKKPVKSSSNKTPGRKSTYSGSVTDSIVERLFSLGSTDKEVYGVLGIGQQTYSDWKYRHPSFFEAINKGKDRFCSEEIEDSLRVRAKGFFYLEETTTRTIEKDDKGLVETVTKLRQIPPDTSAQKHWLKHRSKRWVEEKDTNYNPDVEAERDKLKESARSSAEGRAEAGKVLNDLENLTE